MPNVIDYAYDENIIEKVFHGILDFHPIEGLSAKMIYAPEEATKKYFDILMENEAHRLFWNNFPQETNSILITCGKIGIISDRSDILIIN